MQDARCMIWNKMRQAVVNWFRPVIGWLIIKKIHLRRLGFWSIPRIRMNKMGLNRTIGI